MTLPELNILADLNSMSLAAFQVVAASYVRGTSMSDYRRRGVEYSLREDAITIV